MKPVVLAGGMVSVAILAATVGTRVLPAPDAAQAAPRAQECSGSIGFYSPGSTEIAAYGSAFDAFQAEVVAPKTTNGEQFNILDFEFDDAGKAYFYYDTTC